MARAVSACVATIKIFVLVEWRTRALVRNSNFRTDCLFAYGFHLTLDGMHTFMHGSNQHGQHDHAEKLGNDIFRKIFLHDCVSNNKQTLQILSRNIISAHQHLIRASRQTPRNTRYVNPAANNAIGRVRKYVSPCRSNKFKYAVLHCSTGTAFRKFLRISRKKGICQAFKLT